MDLSSADQYKIYVEEGSAEPEPISQALWIVGIDDAVNGPDWNFDRYLKLSNEDTKTYAGVIAVNSSWGYR